MDLKCAQSDALQFETVQTNNPMTGPEAVIVCHDKI